MFGALPRLLLIAAGAIALVMIASEDFLSTGKASADDESDDGDQNNSLADTVASSGPFGTFHVAARTANLMELLEGDGPYTVFAPTDEAFSALGERLDELLVQPDALAHLLRHHIVEGAYGVDALSEDQELSTMAGGTISISGGASPRIDDATLVEPDVAASNGLIQGIDQVLVAPDPPRKTQRKKKKTKKKTTRKS